MAVIARGFVLFALLAWVLACDLVDPDVRDGTYNLATVNGRELPAIRVATIECDLTVESGILVIGPENSLVFQVLEQSDCTRGGGGILAWYRTYSGSYTVAGATMTISASTLANPNIQAKLEFGGHIVAVVDHTEYATGPGVLRFFQ